MSPRLAAALRELDAAVKAEVEEALAAAARGEPKKKDELARARAVDALKKRGMLPASFKRTAKR